MKDSSLHSFTPYSNKHNANYNDDSINGSFRKLPHLEEDKTSDNEKKKVTTLKKYNTQKD